MVRLGHHLIATVLLPLPLLCGCARSNDSGGEGRARKLIVVATLLPLYDFARNVSGDRADVRLLLPPGTEPHGFEPRPADMAMLSRADIFIYTNRYMEPWADKLLKATESSSLSVVDASQGVRFIAGGIDSAEDGTQNPHLLPGGKEKGALHHGTAADPHIWLDFSNAGIMVGTIAKAFIERDPSSRDLYTTNAEAYKARLEQLDSAYRKGLSHCRKKIFVNGGHYTFGYLAQRYGLHYKAAYGFSPDAEPTARTIAYISKMLRQHGLNHIFYEELLSPRVAETIAKETGATLLKLHGAHNISKEEFAAGRTFHELMEKNLDNLMTGLQCR